MAHLSKVINHPYGLKSAEPCGVDSQIQEVTGIYTLYIYICTEGVPMGGAGVQIVETRIF